ncbi:tetratricopeptide repeat protein [Nocardia heshunensis]
MNQGEVATVQRISDWRSGRNVPAKFESFEPVMLTLIDLVAPPTDERASLLLDPSIWRRTWEAASEPGDARRAKRRRAIPGDHGLPPRATVALRRDVAVLIGRDDDLRCLSQTGDSRSIFVVDGMAGVGKTALVTRAAHLLRSDYRDGCLFVELNGHAPGVDATSAFDVLGLLLNDVGIEPRHVPSSFEGRRDLWRSWLADRRVLLVLDDASDEQQVEPLLPPGPGCLTLISSRRRMIALDGAKRVSLEPLQPAAARELFCELADRQLDTSTMAAVDDIVRLCGHLPLAIVLAAGRLAHHPAWSVAGLAAELAVAEDRLGELQAGHRAVRAGFTTSYRNLSGEQQRLLRWIGLAPGANLSVNAVAALADLSLTTARRQLDALYSVHLIDEFEAGRYRLHDLVREYARTLASEDPAGRGEQALARLLGYYFSVATAACAHQFRPTGYPLRAFTDHTAPVSHKFIGQEDAIQWIRLERANLLACLDYAEHHRPAWFTAMVETMTAWLEREGPRPLAEALHRRAIATAADLGDRVSEAAGLINLGYTRSLTGDYRAATVNYERALTLFTESSDKIGEATSMLNLGAMSWRTGHYEDSIRLCTRALAHFRAVGDPFHEAVALTNLAIAHWLAGDEELGIGLLRQGLHLRREIGDTAGELTGLTLVGLARWFTDSYARVAGLYEEVLEVHRATGGAAGEASCLTNLGILRGRLGDARAIDDLTQAVIRHRQIGSHIGEAFSLVHLGNVHRRGGDSAAAAEQFQRARTLFRDFGDLDGEATVSVCTGILHRDASQFQTADQLFEQALACFRTLGNRYAETELLNEIGQLLIDTGRFDEARAIFTDALALARTIRSRFEHARALEGIARSYPNPEGTRTISLMVEAIEIFRHVGAATEIVTATSYLEQISTATRPPDEQ